MVKASLKDVLNVVNCDKIAVIGCGGSGKSYFSLKLAMHTQLPCYHLDMLFWNPNWVKTPPDEFAKIVDDLTNRDKWIIDGNYGTVLEARFLKADVIIFLDMPTELCLESEKARRGTKRNDLPEYLIETEDLEFIEYIKNFNQNHRNIIVELINKYPEVKVITFKSREEVNQFIYEMLTN